MGKDTLYVVIPCYKEEAVLEDTARQLKGKMERMQAAGLIGPDSRVVFVNDGSTDGTWQIIEALHSRDELFEGIDLSTNRGHQNALLAGLMTVKDRADMVISMDADLQDDIDAMDGMVEQYREGCDIVYGVRSERASDSRFKRVTAQGFYRFMHFLGAEIVYNHADYRLMSRRALQGLEQFGEVNLFLRGIVPMIGYRSGKVYYKRGERLAGESKYPLRKMLTFAIEGITSLSIRPIRMITALGLGVFLASLLFLLYFLVLHFTGQTVQGWSTIVISVWAIGGLQLLAIGVIGEYIGKVYLESKARPRYIVRSYLSHDSKEDTDADQQATDPKV